MARYTGPKNKLSRREGFDLFNKGEKLRKFDVKPGEHGRKRSRKLSDYGRQLRAKQTAKRLYGILEKQFRNYVAKAGSAKVNVGEALISLLERRLDNVIYRLGLAPTRPAARQFVSHGHVLVNGQTINIPSYETKIDDEIEIDKTVGDIPYIQELIEEKTEVPDWLEKKDKGGRVLREPTIEDLKEPLLVVDIVEFYSR